MLEVTVMWHENPIVRTVMACLFYWNLMSTHYTFSNVEESKALKASTGLERVHFKPMMETGRVIKGMKAQDAIAYLEAVMRKERAVPFFRYKGGISHHAQGHEWGCPTSRWPVKCAELYIKLIKTAPVSYTHLTLPTTERV